MNLLFEAMIRVETEKYVCRIWRQINGITIITNELLAQMARKIMVNDTVNLISMVEALIFFDKVNSVEIVDRITGCGVCVHKDWP
jgi:hypothetical protein